MSNHMHHTRALLIVAALCLGLQTFASAGFHNTSNKRFASRCNGPQGAIVVVNQKPGVATAAASPLKALQAQHNPNKLKRAVASFRRLQKRHLKSNAGQVRFPRVMVHTLNGQLVQPNLMQAQSAGKAIGNQGNNLTFQYVGWSASDQAAP